MELHTRADRGARQRGFGAPRCGDVGAEAARLFDEALNGIESGERPTWLPTWAFRKARGLRRRRSFARGWLGGHLGFVEDLAMQEACARHGLAPLSEVPPDRTPTPAQAVAEWRYGIDRHPEAG